MPDDYEVQEISSKDVANIKDLGLRLDRDRDAEPVEVPEDAWDENGFLTDAYLATVPTKGPDPAVWGDDKDRPSPRPEFVATDDAGNEIETKGPDPKQHPNSAR